MTREANLKYSSHPLWLTLGTSSDFSSPLDSRSHSSSMAQCPPWFMHPAPIISIHSLDSPNHTHTHQKKNLFKRPKQTQTGALYQSRGVRCGRRWGGRFKREGIYVYLWLIHVEVCRKQQNSVKQLSFIKKIK